jgi:hypothetical protein
MLVPGGWVPGVPLASSTIGMIRNWFSRTARSGPSPFHSARDRTDTP